MNIGNGKKLVYWGTGKICSMCLKHYPDIKPEFFIDSYQESDSFHNISVKNPDEIINWDELFVVITISAYEEVEKILKSKSLKKNKDYAKYKDYFSQPKETLKEKLSFFQEYIKRNTEYENAYLILAPVFLARGSNAMLHFFREYGKKKFPHKCILFSYLEMVKAEDAKDEMGYPVFDIPDICQWDGRNDMGKNIDVNQLSHSGLLLAEEREWIRELEERKICEDKKLSCNISSEIYWYFKEIFSILKPSRVINWGSWGRLGYILADLAKRNKIPYGLMEYGWIPGTFLFDRTGYAGESVYAVEPEKFLGLEVKSTYMHVQQIKKFIMDTKLDTRSFIRDEDDEKSLCKLNRQKKTVFVVGMDDYDIGINSGSVYWGQYVSSSVSSTAEAVSAVWDVCRRNGWNCIFKPHPRSPIKLYNNSSDSMIEIKLMEIDRLVKLSDVVVSIISKVDYKVLIYGKPLVQLGHTMLSGKGCSYEVHDINILEAQLKAALENGMTQEQNVNFERHIAQLLDNYLWDDMSEREIRYGLSLDTDFFDK